MGALNPDQAAEPRLTLQMYVHLWQPSFELNHCNSYLRKIFLTMRFRFFFERLLIFQTLIKCSESRQVIKCNCVAHP